MSSVLLGDLLRRGTVSRLKTSSDLGPSNVKTSTKTSTVLDVARRI